MICLGWASNPLFSLGVKIGPVDLSTWFSEFKTENCLVYTDVPNRLTTLHSLLDVFRNDPFPKLREVSIF